MLAALGENTHAIVNFAAESHVDRSIANAAEFLRTNITGTQVLLDAARARGVKRFIQVSTDEVMGSLPENEDGVLHRRFSLCSKQSLRRFESGRRTSGARRAPHVWSRHGSNALRQ